MKKEWRSLLAIYAVGFMLAACGGKTFNVKGTISGAPDSVLYFEHIGLSGIEAVDSVRLDADGQFTFGGDAPEAPDFFRLRIAHQIINVAIDSTETITVTATYPQMATAYEVSGSGNNQKIRELALKQIALQSRFMALDRDMTLTQQAVRDSVEKLLRTYKEDVKMNYIFREPYQSYAYFALFQTLGPWLIFDPKTNADDVRAFAAVATSWDTYHPGAERGRNLHKLAIEGMNNVRMQQTSDMPIPSEKIVESGVIDLSLTDNKGRERRLTDLKGSVVLLDFHVFVMGDSPKRILMLRELYNKYHERGFEIYQVSLDTDEHFWKQTTAALPWICVRDLDGLESQSLMKYNVQDLPEFFLIDRDNNLVKRSQQMTDVDAEIRALL